MQLDSRGYPHIAWLERREGRNELGYSFWDGLKWSYLGQSSVYISNNIINPSPNSIVLNCQDKPSIVFSVKAGVGSTLSLATYDDGWEFLELDVSYDVGWIGIVKQKNYSGSSSSSSLGSGDEVNYYAVVYDITDSEFKVYAIGYTWTLIGSISESTDSYSTIEITMCDVKIGVAFIEDGTTIEFNFFDISTDTWSFGAFNTLAASSSYGDILEMDLAGYDTAGVESFCIGWISGNSYSSYVNSAICDSTGAVTPTDLADYNIEVNRVDVIASSSDYLVNGYKKIGVTLDDSELAQIVCLGVSSKIFSLSALNVWSSDLIDLEAAGNGNVYTYLEAKYFDNVKLSFGADSGDIYFFEPSSNETFPVANPDIILLNSMDYAYRVTSFDPQAGEIITDLYNNYNGTILRDSKKPLLISVNKDDYDSNSSSSSSSG
jgi:hypothetical protein